MKTSTMKKLAILTPPPGYVPDPHRPGNFIEARVAPDAASPHYVIVATTRESFGAADGFRDHPLLAFLSWARQMAGWDASFADIVISTSVYSTLRMAIGEWVRLRRERGFLPEEGTVPLGTEGIDRPFVNPEVPAGHVLLMRAVPLAR